MTDIFTKAKRSEVMSRIRGKGNRDTELRLIEIFRAHKITGWRRNHTLYGKPDFVFRAARVTAFVDGCFWHGCPIHGTKPRTNAAFWRKKIARNKERDREVFRVLRKAGWRVVRVWEHELGRKNERRLVARLRRFLVSSWKRCGCAGVCPPLTAKRSFRRAMAATKAAAS